MRLPLLFPLFFIAACTVNNASCKTDSGTVNTYSVFGHWKKLSPYQRTRTDAELELNYDVLAVPRGSVLCAGRVDNGGAPATLYHANYTNDLLKQLVTVQYLDGTSPTGVNAESATYSFSGYCDQTHMTLTFPDRVEVYEALDKNDDPASCQ